MNWRKPLIFAGLYLTGSKIPKHLKEIKRTEKLPQEEIKINRGNFESNLFFLKKTGLLTKDKKILEIGSGNGTMTNYLSKQGYNIIGTEINGEYIKFAKNNFGIDLKKMSVVNNFFREKIKKQFGVLGLTALRIFNPDTFPYFLRTNFYLENRRL